MRNLFAAIQVVAALPGRSLLLSLPVAVSVALAMTTLAMDRGVNAMAQEAVKSWGNDQVVLHGSGRQIAGQIAGTSSLTDADLEALRGQLRGVKHVLPTQRDNNAKLSFGGKSFVCKLYAVTPAWAQARNFGAARGEFLDDSDEAGKANICLLGQTTVRELFGKEDPIDKQIRVNDVIYRVKGVLVERGSSPAEGDRDARIVIPLSTFPSRAEKRYDQIVIQVADPTAESVERIARETRDIVRRTHGLAEQSERPNDFDVRDPWSVAAQARKISRGVLLLLLGLAALTALVAMTVVAIVFQQATRARRHEIGLRRAIGAQPGDILRQIWFEGVLVSLLGGAAGMGLGLAAIWALRKWSGVPVQLDIIVVMTSLALVLLTSIAGLLPARSAASLDPAEALRPTTA